jgi:hypothetical protein
MKVLKILGIVVLSLLCLNTLIRLALTGLTLMGVMSNTAGASQSYLTSSLFATGALFLILGALLVALINNLRKEQPK